mgnify:CR=1 FL=1
MDADGILIHGARVVTTSKSLTVDAHKCIKAINFFQFTCLHGILINHLMKNHDTTCTSGIYPGPGRGGSSPRRSCPDISPSAGTVTRRNSPGGGHRSPDAEIYIQGYRYSPWNQRRIM